MAGRSIFHLLAGLVIVVTPLLSASDEARTAAPPRRSAATPHVRRIPTPPARRPGSLLPISPAQATRSSALSELVRAAGIIFSGTVTRIQPGATSSGQSIPTVSITFQMENSLRGNLPTREITIHEWIALWQAGQRYRVGEHVLLFLYPQSKLGLTSSVGGQVGRFALDEHGTVLFGAHHTLAFRGDPVLGGKSRVLFRDFALAVRQASEGE